MSNLTQFPGDLQNLVPARGVKLLADNGVVTGLVDAGDLLSAPGKSFLTGEGVPAFGLGNPGDSYMDLSTGNVWNCMHSSWAYSGVNIVLSTSQLEVPQIVFRQVFPMSTWNIGHGLNRHPTLVVIDSAGDTVEGSITFIDLNTVSVNFSVAISGIAYLS